MRYLIVSDIHANLPALNAVLAAAASFDRIWCLGDIVGYGPFPNECIARLREFPLVSLAGNHDWAAIGKLDLGYFNREARTAVAWTRAMLTPENKDFLESLPSTTVENGFTLAHGSPSQPIEEYILDPLSAEQNFRMFKTQVCLVGHTHWPIAFFRADGLEHICIQIAPQWNNAILLKNGRWIINPGSVGQPRDGDPSACYALLNVETGEWEYRRVPYPVEETQARMRQHKLPDRLIERLSIGH
jgi:diadenosine tetraphosphatase ApaH/serine/threonine PP2A family protein phosphatase